MNYKNDKIQPLKYSVSAKGKDNLDRKSPKTAWKSIAKGNETLLQPADSALFSKKRSV